MTDTTNAPPHGLNPDRVGIYMDVLARIIADLNASEELQQIFGVPVANALVVVADQNDLRIEESGKVNISKAQSDVFLRVLEHVITDNAV